MSCFIWHDWSKWEQYLWEGSVRHPNKYEGKPIEISENRQKRKCVKCGKVEDVRYAI